MCFHDVEQSVHDSCRSSELSHSAEQVAYVSNSEEAKRLSQLPRHAVMAKVGQAWEAPGYDWYELLVENDAWGRYGIKAHTSQ